MIVYHWSPSERRIAILQQGLILYANPVTQSRRYPYICFGTSPRYAWSLSAQSIRDDEEWDPESWDLWELLLNDNDQVEFMTHRGPEIIEVRTRNSIPADRLWLAGCRPVLSGLEKTKQGERL